MSVESNAGGTSCSTVLGSLSDFLEGDVTPGLKARIIEHVQGCQHCGKFATEYRSLLEALRTSRAVHLQEHGGPTKELRESLEAALDRS
jgi:predicted anti-sigma-YlaC factor YlaD